FNIYDGSAYNEKMRIESTGDVGIGTTAPNARLYVMDSSGSFSNIALFRNNTALATGVGPALRFDGNGGTDMGRIGFIWEAAANDNAAFVVEARAADVTSEKMRVTSGGSIGIGTTAPAATLDVRGNDVLFQTEGTRQQTILRDYSSGAVWHGPFLVLARGRGTAGSASFPNAGDYLGTISFRNHTIPSNGASIIAKATETHSATVLGTSLELTTIANGTNSPTTRLFIEPEGNVGIGSSNPDYRLEVAGTISSTSGGYRYPDGTTQTTSAASILMGAPTGTVNASSTGYTSFGHSTWNTTETGRVTPVPVAGTVSKLYIRTSTAQNAGGNMVCSIRKNSVDTAVVVTIAAGAAAGTFSDTTNTVAFAAGDLISLGCANAYAGASASVVSISAVYRY
ncbi:MAG: hypothetical protein AAB250_04560, partial [Bdellovibrionota bacterium]